MAATLGRAFAALAVVAKLLVPVGYMPASLADGGPFMLCGSGLPAAFGVGHGHGAESHDPPVHDQAGHDGSAHQRSELVSHVGLAEGQVPAKAGGEPSAEHHEWERCSLGGLASLAALASDWQLELPSLGTDSVSVSDQEFLIRSPRPAFRSRAPPISHA